MAAALPALPALLCERGNAAGSGFMGPEKQGDFILRQRSEVGGLEKGFDHSRMISVCAKVQNSWREKITCLLGIYHL